ncbi:hypothetical protein M513_03979, partial [Trichuris suis]
LFFIDASRPLAGGRHFFAAARLAKKQPIPTNRCAGWRHEYMYLTSILTVAIKTAPTRFDSRKWRARCRRSGFATGSARRMEFFSYHHALVVPPLAVGEKFPSQYVSFFSPTCRLQWPLTTWRLCVRMEKNVNFNTCVSVRARAPACHQVSYSMDERETKKAQSSTASHCRRLAERWSPYKANTGACVGLFKVEPYRATVDDVCASDRRLIRADD